MATLKEDAYLTERENDAGEIAEQSQDLSSSSEEYTETKETAGNSSETEESQQQVEITEELEQSEDEPELEPNLPLREVSILLLGETGVGKSTWINAIANYLNYDTLNDAIEAWAVEPMVIIPSQFTMTDDDYKEITVPIGDSDANEVQTTGQSATQHPTTYTFKTRNLLIRIIDTPGIGDTRGIEQDKENFQKIMNHISHVDVIHGICVLLKPNNSRLNIFFEFCVKELITQLHRECTQNIAFCFTNARSTFYRPGDTLAALRTLLQIENTNYSLIPLEKKTIYCLDNEAFRFLAAVKFGLKFENNAKANFAESWKTSVIETGRMVKYFLTLKPHETKNTVTLNTTRQTLIKLAKPLAEVSQTIQTNISLLEDKAEELKNLDSEAKGLEKVLNIKQLKIEKVDIDFPKTVCADPKCSEKVSVYTTAKNEELYVTDYKQVCHDHCYIRGVSTNQLNCAELQGCWAMGNDALTSILVSLTSLVKGGSGGFGGYLPRRGFCRHEKCGHGWEKHMHITYDLKREMVDVIDKNVEMSLKTKKDRIEATQSAIKQCEKRRKDYEFEQRIITKTSAAFAVFLKENSITPYNNAIIKYLDYMIELEKEKVSSGGMKMTLNKLQKTKQIYEEEEKVLLDAIKDSSSGAGNTSLEDINKSLNDLCTLPLTGATIKTLLVTATESESRCYQEKQFIPAHNKSMVYSEGHKGHPSTSAKKQQGLLGLVTSGVNYLAGKAKKAYYKHDAGTMAVYVPPVASSE